jgi:hypothetical protein
MSAGSCLLRQTASGRSPANWLASECSTPRSGRLDIWMDVLSTERFVPTRDAVSPLELLCAAGMGPPPPPAHPSSVVAPVLWGPGRVGFDRRRGRELFRRAHCMPCPGARKIMMPFQQAAAA